jgi:hypothetical protein
MRRSALLQVMLHVLQIRDEALLRHVSSAGSSAVQRAAGVHSTVRHRNDTALFESVLITE